MISDSNKYTCIILILFLIIIVARQYILIRAKIPVLPVLNSDNRNLYPLWHEYYEKVYGESVLGDVDLNMFTFFYHFAPLHVWPVCNTLLVGISGIYDIAFTTSIPLNTPETKIGKKGYFVSRRQYPYIDKNVEVIRTRMPLDNSATKSLKGESKCAWYYHTVGSGLFINIQNPKILEKRRDCLRTFGEQWYGDDDEQVQRFMSRHYLSSIIFEYKGTTSIERHREIIVLLDSPSDSACPLPFSKLQVNCECGDDEVMECKEIKWTCKELK